MVSPITANLLLTIWRPFQMGATVDVLPESLKGRVIDRNMMYTVLRESTGVAVYVSHNLFFQKMFKVTDDSEQHLFEFLEHQKTSVKPPPEN